jgi:predicted RNA-binding Zn-ribbon protein involved in translation (DUF1610 family)
MKIVRKSKKTEKVQFVCDNCGGILKLKTKNCLNIDVEQERFILEHKCPYCNIKVTTSFYYREIISFYHFKILKEYENYINFRKNKMRKTVKSQ